jgi:ubiquinone biosynthesis protein UbiJ
MIMISSTFSHFLNHLLTQEPWAARLLQQHAGKVASFDLELVQINVQVCADGLIQAAKYSSEDGQEKQIAQNSQVKISIKPSDLPLILQNRERAVSYVKIEGDADFANTISQLSQDLRWEVEEDLSKIMGDVAAVRMVSTGQKVLKSLQKTHQSVQENLAEYFLEENPLLVRPSDVQQLGQQIVKIRDDVERFAKRIERLEKMRTEKQKKWESEQQ